MDFVGTPGTVSTPNFSYYFIDDVLVEKDNPAKSRDTTICLGATVDLIHGSPDDFIGWSKNGEVSGILSTGDTLTVSPDTSTVYYWHTSDSSAHQYTIQVIYEEQFSLDTLICEHGMLELVSGYVHHQGWSYSGLEEDIFSTEPSIQIQASSDTVFHMHGACQTSAISVAVRKQSNGFDSLLCTGDTLLLTSASQGFIGWSTDGTEGGIFTTDTSIQVMPSEDVVYFRHDICGIEPYTVQVDQPKGFELDTCILHALTLSAETADISLYRWQDSTNTPHISIQEAGQYQVEMVTENGCIHHGIFNVAACPRLDLFIPNVITPNGDGTNEAFRIVGIEQCKENHLKIFNRWGQAVFEAYDYQNDWRGANTNSTYYYLFQCTSAYGEEISLKGAFTVFK